MEPHVPSPKRFFTQRCLLIVPNHDGEQNVLLYFSVNIQSSAVIAPKLFAHYNNQISALSRKDKGYNIVLQIKYLVMECDKIRRHCPHSVELSRILKRSVQLPSQCPAINSHSANVVRLLQ